MVQFYDRFYPTFLRSLKVWYKLILDSDSSLSKIFGNFNTIFQQSTMFQIYLSACFWKSDVMKLRFLFLTQYFNGKISVTKIGLANVSEHVTDNKCNPNEFYILSINRRIWNWRGHYKNSYKVDPSLISNVFYERSTR